MNPLPRPELLAPAGDWECVRAAVENGADAIYFGLDRFNARMRARNFTEADLPGLMEFLHRRGVRGYVTFNTLVFPEELPAAAEYLRSIIAAGVDAAIVQDVGICRLIRRISPDFPIHGSTQMTVTSPAGVEMARELGCELVVLARENSIKDIAAIQSAQAEGAAAGRAPLPLEVFVHGALCVAYSGQCLTSESLGGRSANRGECAQACRMPYELVCDGKPVDLGDRRYLLSPQDLSGLEVLPDLVRAGVASLKIEGRLKSPGYVAGITRVYREALDRLGAELGCSRDPDRIRTIRDLPGFDADRARYALEMGFSRGLETGWFRGINNQELVHARFGKKRGVYLGEVVSVERAQVLLRSEGPVKPGDGVVFDAGRPDLDEEGGRVYAVHPRPGGLLALEFGHDAVDLQAVLPGQRLWKTNDPALDRDVQRTYAGDTPRWQRPVALEVHGHAGVPMTLLARDERGLVARVESQIPLAAAEKQPLATERLRDQLGRLGGTPFRLGELRNHLEGAVILPVSELNRLRREVVAELDKLRVAPLRWQLAPTVPASAWSVPGSDTAPDPHAAPELIVLARRMEQLEAALRCGVTTLYCDFEDPKRYRDAVRLVHESCACNGPSRTVWVAPPRVHKPGEEWILNLVRSSDADGYLVRNAEHIRFFAGQRRRGDFSLNVANPLSAEHFVRGHGLEGVTASYDLNARQLEGLLRGVPPEWIEITLHQHMPMFHMEHCVFCAFLSKGTDYTNCGRPCDKHEVRLRDRVGMEHPLKADSGCRNTVFNARAQTGAEQAGLMRALGVRRFRIEFVDETPDAVERTVARYRALLRGEVTGEQLWRELNLQNQLGVTRGQLDQTEARKVFPKERPDGFGNPPASVAGI